MIRIIQRRERKTSTSYDRVFDYVDQPGRGFSFRCDEAGVILPGSSPDALRNFRECVLGTMKPAVTDLGIRTYTHSWTEPSIGLCVCGEEVVLDHFTNTCSGCNRDYNSAGQELAPRSQWGEETGESLAEIMMADTNPFGGDR